MNPRNQSIPVPAGGPHNEGIMDTPITVLVVDDHAHAREVISRLLEAEGYKVVIATNGNEAIEMLERNDEIGAVVTDVTMPDMTGVERAYHVKAHHPGRPI